ncbi:MAG TPA: hypothetical protein VKP65_06655 [Rhodothermales bacterium]|nr:hypothetical protein [Rhodothermales bacterium]
MKKTASFLLIALLFAGCDSYRDVAGPDPADLVKAGSYKVSYEVTGTYASCEIQYVNASRKLVTLSQAVELPWELTMNVFIDPSSGPFEARISATCADSTKLGKSTVTLLVDNDLKARGTATGFGATAQADHQVGRR